MGNECKIGIGLYKVSSNVAKRNKNVKGLMLMLESDAPWLGLNFCLRHDDVEIEGVSTHVLRKKRQKLNPVTRGGNEERVS